MKYEKIVPYTIILMMIIVFPIISVCMIASGIKEVIYVYIFITIPGSIIAMFSIPIPFFLAIKDQP